MKKKLYLGIDFGTSGVRAAVMDADGLVHAEAATPLPASTGAGRHREQYPEDWWSALELLLRQLAELADLKQIHALAVDGTSGTLLLCDADGQPLTPALMYDDTRAVGEAERIREWLPPVSGAHGAGSSLAKLLHLLPAHPHAAHALHQADWIAGRLCDRFGVCDENNALKLGYDVVRRQWPAELVQGLGLPHGLLPEVIPPGQPVGAISGGVAATLGLPRSACVMAGTTDSVAAFIASGAHEVGEAVTSLGSTLVLKVISEVPVFDPAHGVYSHRLGDVWLAGGASNSGGAVLRQYFTDGQMAEMTPGLTPERHTGHDFYPLPAPGERFPVNDPDFPPRMEPRPGDDAVFFQALLEGMARIECDGYSLLARLGAPYPVHVRSLGGGADNPAWTEIRRRQVGVPMLPARYAQAACGAAILARGY